MLDHLGSPPLAVVNVLRGGASWGGWASVECTWSARRSGGRTACVQVAQVRRCRCAAGVCHECVARRRWRTCCCALPTATLPTMLPSKKTAGSFSEAGFGPALLLSSSDVDLLNCASRAETPPLEPPGWAWSRPGCIGLQPLLRRVSERSREPSTPGLLYGLDGRTQSQTGASGRPQACCAGIPSGRGSALTPGGVAPCASTRAPRAVGGKLRRCQDDESGRAVPPCCLSLARSSSWLDFSSGLSPATLLR
jgi:hypothetical protein